VANDEARPEQALPEQPEQPPKRRRLRRRWIALIVVASILVVLVVAAFITAHYTSRSSFCDTCHEMDPYYTSWQASSHATAECKDCHIPPGVIPYVETKLASFREVWVHLTGGAEAPLAVTREIPSSSCRRCHSLPEMLIFQNSSFSHEAHKDQPCIKCHVRVVHKSVNPPYYSSPGKMESCLACHDGTTAPASCSYCHTPGHEPRGECASCHDTQDWGSNFVHPFPRTGGHVDIACNDCHAKRTGAEPIPGTGLYKASPVCASCHTPGHTPRGNCNVCHTTESWSSGFNHPFPRTGGHAGVACATCHKTRSGAALIPGTTLPKAPSACVSCHGDHHGGLTNCARCHSVAGWKPAHFSHPSAGPHVSGEERLSCSRCHPSGYGSSVSCTSCHGSGGGGDD
jgi:nitrate/TMAO reductase-like tetraheme cytochrome c subunit